VELSVSATVGTMSCERGLQTIVAIEEPTPDFTITLPDARELDQNEEFCELLIDGHSRRVRFHDYAEIYEIPGLYERLFADTLQCASPDVVAGLLADSVRAAGDDPAQLRVLDFGAGNGMVGEALSGIGVRTLYGLDLLPQARAAALRDRPGLYADYVADDVTALSPRDAAMLRDAHLNCLVCVAALGFDDVPPAAFAAAFNYVGAPAWCAFNLRDRFVDQPGPFSQLLQRMVAEGVVVQTAQTRYQHRLSVAGEPLFYDAVVARKQRDIPLDWVQ
jgi:hypothetical protein